MKRTAHGFTIVELLIVIVVIAILAAVSIIAYNGIQQRSRASVASNATSQVARKVKLWQADNENVTPTCAKFYELVTNKTDSSACTFDYNGTNYQYSPGSGGSYCATATNGNISYKTTDGSSPSNGGCSGHNSNGSITNIARDPNAAGSASYFSSMGSSPPPSSDSIATDLFHNGTSSYKKSITGTGGAAAKALTPGYNTSTRISVGESLSWSFWIYSTRAGTITTYAEGSKVSDNSYTGCGGNPSQFTVPANTWTKVNASCSPSIDMYLGGAGGYNLQVQSGDSVWFDEFMITKSSTQYNYADGGSPNWNWNGTANNSTSTGPAL